MLLNLQRAPLNGHRTVEVAKPLIARSGIGHRGRVDREILQFVETNHALEVRQGLIELTAHDVAHSEIIQRDRLVIPV